MKETIDTSRDDVAFKTGERVAWQYEHSLNSKSRVTRTKFGTFVGRVRHTKRWTGDRLAGVSFDGNKRMSKVPLDDFFLAFVAFEGVLPFHTPYVVLPVSYMIYKHTKQI